jgi:hypothetical protein
MYHSDVNLVLLETYSVPHRVHTSSVPFTSGYKTYLCLSEWNSYEISSAVSLLYVTVLLNPYPNVNVKHSNGHGHLQFLWVFVSNAKFRKCAHFRHQVLVSTEEKVPITGGIQNRNICVWRRRHPVFKKICLRKPNTMVNVQNSKNVCI